MALSIHTGVDLENIVADDHILWSKTNQFNQLFFQFACSIASFQVLIGFSDARNLLLHIVLFFFLWYRMNFEARVGESNVASASVDVFSTTSTSLKPVTPNVISYTSVSTSSTA